MFKKGRFPTEEEVAEKLERVQNFPAVIEELVERINGLLEINFDDLDSHQLKFVLGDLPGIFASLVSLKNQNRKNIKLINDFTFSYLCLTAKMELHIDLLHAVGNVFDSSMRKYVPVVTKSQTKTVKEQFFRFSPDFDYLKPQDIRPHCNQIVKEIIVQLFSSHLFEKAFSFINEQKMTPECFAEFINIYSGVESSLSESVISFMLPTILDETINLLLKNESDFSGMCHFLSVHFKCSKKHVLPIIQTLCKMTEVGKTTIRSSVVSEIIEISNIEGNEELISSNSQVIKETFINAISLNQNAIILKQIYSFFPKFSEICQFTDDNVKEILTKSSGTCPSDMIIKIIPNLHDNDLDSFANFLIKNNYFYPDLFSFLLTKVKKTQAYKLLDFILKNPERLRKEGLVDFEMSTTIMDYIIDITPTTPEMVESLSLFYLKAPTLEEFHNFIMETVKMFMECPQLIDVLNSFSSVMDKFDSTQTILQVFELVFESIEEEGAKSKLLPLIPVLSDWIAAKKDDIPINEFIEYFRKLDFSNCPNVIPSFFNTIFANQESSEQEPIIELLTDIVLKTVNKQHAHWAITELFSRINYNQEKVKAICTKLLENQTDNTQHMIYEAVLFEADFARLGEQFGLQQRIHLREFDVNITVSLTSMHSSRRLYAEVSKAIGIPISDFLLWVYDPQGEFVIPYGCPLTNYNITAKTVLEISVQKDTPNGAPVDPYCTFFINTLSEEKNTIIVLGMMEETENVNLFNVCKLLPMPKHNNSCHPLTMLLRGECTSIDSFIGSKALFPYAVEALLTQNKEPSPEVIEKIAVKLATNHYNSVSYGNACDALMDCDKTYHFSTDSIEKCMIEASDQRIRAACKKIIATDNKEDIISLIKKATLNENRPKTKQFFEYVRNYSLNPQVFIDFYKDLKQFEFSAVWDVDETFIGLIKLIPANDETIKITTSRLFTLPTVKEWTNPFLQTAESREAAYQFLNNELAFPIIDSLLGGLKSSTTTPQTFNDDFTPKGRQGIVNLGSTCYINSVLQNIVAMTNFAAPILSLEAEGLSPFMLQFRNILALIKYGRGAPASISDFTATLPDFQPNIQEDAEEFFNMLINKIIEDFKDSKALSDLMCGKITWEICSVNTNTVMSTRDEYFYYISLWTKGLHNIKEAFNKYFEDSEISGGYANDKGEKVPAVKRARVSTWPGYLVLQLQRWEYSLDTMERKKLTSELQFPVELVPPNCDKQYILSGVIIHDGDAESGHYTAIVRNETGDDWYFCNDNEIRNFDPSLLGPWCFGSEPKQTNEQIWTGYLLFYKRSDLVPQRPNIKNDLEVFVDTYNANSWSSTCLFSEQFVRFVEDIALDPTPSPTKSRIIFTTFFRIVLLNDSALSKWADFFVKNVLTTKDSCRLFFKYLSECIGSSIPTILSISDIITEKMEVIVKHAISILNDTTEPLRLLLRNTSDYGAHKRAMVFAFYLIGIACDTLEVDWSQEEEALFLMSCILTIEMQKEVQRVTSRQHFGAYENFAGLLANVTKSSTCSEAILTFLDINTLNRIVPALKKSDNFMTFLISLSNSRPDLLQHLIDANQQVQNLVNSAIPIPLGGTNEIDMDIDISFYFKHAEPLIFNENEEIRAKTLETLLLLVGSPEPHIENYFKLRPYDENRTRPDFNVESSFVHFLLKMSIKCKEFIMKKEIDTCKEYFALLTRIVPFAPRTVSFMFPDFINTIVFCMDSKDKLLNDILPSLVSIVHNLVAYDKRILAFFNPLVIEAIKSLPVATMQLIEILIMVPEVFLYSRLLDLSFDFLLVQTSRMAAIDKIVELLARNPLNGKDIFIKQEPRALWVLKSANEMWKIDMFDKKDLCAFMVKAMKFAVPFKLFCHLKYVAQSLDIIKGFSPESLNEFV